MDSPRPYMLRFCLLILLLTGLSGYIIADNEVLNKSIRITKERGTIYQMLNHITELSSYMFIYDSRLIDNDKKVRLRKGTYTIYDAVRQIINNPTIEILAVGNHILLQQKELKTSNFPILSTTDIIKAEATEPDSFLTIEGVLRDRSDERTIAFASIGIQGSSIGTISNQDGEFRIRIPDSISSPTLYIAHLGYETQTIDAKYLDQGYHQILMDQKVIPIQEIVVLMGSPFRLIEDMLNNIPRNYARNPVIHTAFYREGVNYRNRFVSLSESVMNIYKAPHYSNSDQAKLLKMRTIENDSEKDTLLTRFKSGVNASLMLDIIKYPTDFLILDNNTPYEYFSSGMEMIGDRLTNVVYFEQKRGGNEILYKGYLYIDTEDKALVEARFEIDPRYVAQTTNTFIQKKSSKLELTAQKIEYKVSYKKWDGVYYINHVRGDLHFRVKKKRNLFHNVPLHFWFEMVNCMTETDDVNRFNRSELFPVRTVFAETEFDYDEAFWEGFNIIQPEEELSAAISKITARIEKINYE